jgi:hypothetical protein
MAYGLIVFALFAASQLVRYFLQPDVLYPDFYGLWSFARFAQTHTPAAIYDDEALARFQVELDAGFTGHYPYLYPPPFLLLVWPLGHLPYVAARFAWIVLSLVAVLVAVCGCRRKRALALATLLAPATVVCTVYGQNGLISAALMIAGVRMARNRPILAGVLFGALIYKPQFGILIPVALAAAGLWRAIAAAAVAATALALASILTFGAAMWPSWIAAARAVSTIGGEDRAHLDRLMPTVAAAARRLGGAPELANATQVFAALVAAAIVWRCWRRRVGLATDLSLPVATFLATPYGFGYDLPMVAAAVLLALDDWGRRFRSFAFADLLIALLVLMLPAIFLSTLTVGAPLGVLFLAALLWRLAVDGRGSAIKDVTGQSVWHDTTTLRGEARER